MAMDFDLVVTCFNIGAERLMSRKGEEVVGKHIFDVFPEARGTAFEENYRRAAENRCTLSFDAYFDAEPHRNWYNVRVSPTDEDIRVSFQAHGQMMQLEKDLRQITTCLLSLGNDYKNNVDSLVRLAGKIMKADFSVYRALKGDALAVVGAWNIPQAFDSKEMTGSGLCPDLLLRSEENHLLVQDVHESDYGKNDPAVAELGIKTYLGHVIMTGDMRIGVLCVCYRKAVDLSDDQLDLMKIIASALGNVEMRREKEQLLVNSNKLLEDALSHLKEAQDEAIRHERMSALGQVVAGIAHDFNNALVPILGISDLLLTNPELLNDKHQLATDLEMIRHSAATAASTVKSLRDFYRPASEDEFDTVDLAEVIQEAVKATEHAWKIKAMEEERPIEMQVMTGPIPPTDCDKAAIRAVLENLITNSVEAMPKGGIITVRAWYEEGFIYISISDNGKGMSEKVRAHCLDPFFTTKFASDTGMGLSRSYGVVARHGGSMTVKSSLGNGTEIVIKLKQRAHKEKPSEPAADEEHGKPKPLDILVIDDDERTRYLLEKLLSSQAKKLTICSSGEEALAAFKSSKPTLVITDKAMPSMDGVELSKRLKSESPEIPIIMLTGYGDLMDPDELPPSVDVLLTKPVTLQDVYEAIEKAMAV